MPLISAFLYNGNRNSSSLSSSGGAKAEIQHTKQMQQITRIRLFGRAILCLV